MLVLFFEFVNLPTVIAYHFFRSLKKVNNSDVIRIANSLRLFML